MDKYEYIVHYQSKHSSSDVYKAIFKRLKSHLWQIQDVDSMYELRSNVASFYLSLKPAHRLASSVKSLASAVSGTYGPIYIVLRAREEQDTLTIVGNKPDVLQAAFVLRGSS